MPPPHLLILTADPSSGALDDPVAERIAALASHDAHWLAPAAALEIPLNDRALRKTAEAALQGRPIDVNIVSADPAQRRKKLLVSDMDSTMIEQEVVDELARIAGRGDEIAAITIATMRGELDFRSSLRRRVAMLAGLTLDDIATAAARITFMPGAAALVAGMKQAGATTALVSGGFTVFVEPVAAKLGFDVAIGNVLEIENGRLTGRIAEPLLDANSKRKALHGLAAELNVAVSQTIAIGDGANDIPMLQSAGLGVAFRAKPAVRAAMRASPTGAVIDHADLTAILYLQGV